MDSCATGVVGASFACSGVRFKAGLQSNRDGTSAVLTRMDGAAHDSWSPAASRPRCSKRRDHRSGAAAIELWGGRAAYSLLRGRRSAVRAEANQLSEEITVTSE